MWARKRIDISAADLLLAGCYCFGSKPIGLSESLIDDCFYSDQLLVSLSVRSGFDLALTALDWPAGSEILFSGYTIPDMPRLAVAHGCIPIGVLFLPFDVSMPVSEIERMANVIRQAGIRLPDSIAIRALSVSESAPNRSPLNV